MKTKKTIINTVLLVAGVTILLNVLSNRFFVRLDLTKDRIYTLNSATKNILRNLEEPVTITAYFSKKLPPYFLKDQNVDILFCKGIGYKAMLLCKELKIDVFVQDILSIDDFYAKWNKNMLKMARDTDACGAHNENHNC